jgi:hypothetical protein
LCAFIDCLAYPNLFGIKGFAVVVVVVVAFIDCLVVNSLDEEISKAKETRKYLPAVSTSLALAAGIGLVEAVALILGSGFLMNAMGISVVCPKPKLVLYILSLLRFHFYELPFTCLCRIRQCESQLSNF